MYGKGLESACAFQKKVEKLPGVWNLCKGTEFCSFFAAADRYESFWGKKKKKQDYKGGVGKTPQEEWCEYSNLILLVLLAGRSACWNAKAGKSCRIEIPVLTLKLSLDVRTDVIEV